MLLVFLRVCNVLVVVRVLLIAVILLVSYYNESIVEDQLICYNLREILPVKRPCN